GEEALVGRRLELAGAGALSDVARVELWLWIAVLEVLEDDGRVVELHRPVDQHRHLGLRIDRQDVRVLRLVSRASERDGDQVVLEPLLVERDARLAREEAEGSRVEFHAAPPARPVSPARGIELWSPTTRVNAGVGAT